MGGAAINQQYGQRILFVDGEQPYEPGVFYCKDAFEGLEVVDRLVDRAAREEFVARTIAAATQARKQPERGRTVLEKLGKEAFDGARSQVRTDTAIPTPPFWGTRVVKNVKLDDVWPHMDLNTLFRLQRGAKNAKGDDYRRLLEDEFMPRLRELQRDAKARGWLKPAITYGYFPVQADGNDLIVYDPKIWGAAEGKLEGRYMREVARFAFPRQPARERLCLADYFAAVDSGRMDVAALQVVTLGNPASEEVERLQAAADYSAAYFAHGLGVTAAEGLAEYTNQAIRRNLGLAEDPKRGKRYSWGYPAIPTSTSTRSCGGCFRPSRSAPRSPSCSRSCPSKAPRRSWCITRRRRIFRSAAARASARRRMWLGQCDEPGVPIQRRDMPTALPAACPFSFSLRFVAAMFQLARRPSCDDRATTIVRVTTVYAKS